MRLRRFMRPSAIRYMLALIVGVLLLSTFHGQLSAVPAQGKLTPPSALRRTVNPLQQLEPLKRGKL